MSYLRIGDIDKLTEETNRANPADFLKGNADIDSIPLWDQNLISVEVPLPTVATEVRE